MGRILDLHCLKTSDKTKLIEFGISSTDRLLLVAADRAGRELVADETGVMEELVLETVHLADMMRVKGIGTEYAELLDRAGVRTLKQLARRSPERLFNDLEELNDDDSVVRRLPSTQDVAGWIDLANALDSLVSH